MDPSIDQDPFELARERLTYADEPNISIDSIWWNWSEGNVVPYPSKRLPTFLHPGYQRWLDDGIDIVKVFLDETHKRGIESFYAHRMNGSDGDPMFIPGVGLVHDGVIKVGDDLGQRGGAYTIPMKEKHPEWLFHTTWSPMGYWNFAIEEVRSFILGNIRELAERYNFDGIDLDFARGGMVFPQGEGWPNREALTTFMRDVRAMLLEIEDHRGQPFLLSARVPGDIVGCHFDGLDVETWANERIIDIFVLGCRSFEVDLQAFRSLTNETPIKLYPALDDHHSSDSYCTPPINVFRGVFSNWYRQGADGVQTFNWAHGPYNHMADPAKSWDLTVGDTWAKMHGQAYRELSDPDSMKRFDKTFVIQRRGGGHGDPVVPDPETWYTPRVSYHNSNMLSQLPKQVADDPKTDTMIRLYVGDDINAEIDHVHSIVLRILLHDSANGDYVHLPKSSPPPQSDSATIDRVVIRDWLIPEREGKQDPTYLYNSPPRKGIEDQIAVRINNVPLSPARVESGWLVFAVNGTALALGDNLVGISHNSQNASGSDMVLEKLELHVEYSKL